MAEPLVVTKDMLNEVLAEASRDRGECLCIHKFMTLIDFCGTTCGWCGQLVPENAVSAGYKAIRTEEIKRRRPEWVRSGG